MDVPGLRAQGRLPGVRHKPTICCLMQHRHICPAGCCRPARQATCPFCLAAFERSGSETTEPLWLSLCGCTSAGLPDFELVNLCRKAGSTEHRCGNRLCFMRSLLHVG